VFLVGHGETLTNLESNLSWTARFATDRAQNRTSSSNRSIEAALTIARLTKVIPMPDYHFDDGVSGLVDVGMRFPGSILAPQDEAASNE
jgi:hypothetical protein